MFLTVFVWAFFFMALIVWLFFEYTLAGNTPTYDPGKSHCHKFLRECKDDVVAAEGDSSEPRIVVLVAKTPAAKLAARIVLGFAAALAGLWIWGFVDAASVPGTGKFGNVLFHAVRVPQLNPVSRSGYLCYLQLSDKTSRQKNEDADEERPAKRRRRRDDDDRENDDRNDRR